MNRAERSEQKIADLYENYKMDDCFKTDPEFSDIKKRFIFGDVFWHEGLNDKERTLITVAVLAALHTVSQIRDAVKYALNAGAEPEEIKEAVYHCAPYIGFPKTEDALKAVNDVFSELNIIVEKSGHAQVNEETRLEKGIAVQKSIFGDSIDSMRANAPEEQKHIQDYLSAFCFGDFYTRSGLDIKLRELLTFCIISALGGCENQVKAHVQGNLNAGSSKEKLICAITQCLPYIGFPRTLNAIACINEAAG